MQTSNHTCKTQTMRNFLKLLTESPSSEEVSTSSSSRAALAGMTPRSSPCAEPAVEAHDVTGGVGSKYSLFMCTRAKRRHPGRIASATCDARAQLRGQRMCDRQ